MDEVLHMMRVVNLAAEECVLLRLIVIFNLPVFSILDKSHRVITDVFLTIVGKILCITTGTNFERALSEVVRRRYPAYSDSEVATKLVVLNTILTTITVRLLFSR